MLSINTPDTSVGALAVTFDDVLLAAERIREFSRRTPVLSSRLFNRACSLDVFFKCENLQRGGAFKIRGAANFLMSLSADERRRGVVTFSSGNHGQAVAMAATQLQMRAVVVMPTDAPRSKVDATRSYGQQIVFFDRQRESREAIAQRIAEETGAVVIPSYDHPWIVAGQGTAALELLQQQPDLNLLAIPLGGGGLLSGSLVVARALRPQMQVVGIEPELANDWAQSIQRGERVEIAPPATIADGLRTATPGLVTFPLVRALGNGVLTVTEEEIKSAVRFLLSRMKLLVEPSGAVGAAAALAGKLAAYAGPAGIILSGGNVDFDVLAAICQAA